MTRGELQAELASSLGAPHEARFILEEVAGSDAPAGDLILSGLQVAAARSMASRRAGGEPLQYIFGHWSFRSLDLLVDARALIPRPETEQVVQVALGELAQLARIGTAAPVIVDAGTGSGAIALSLAVELSAGAVWALDASADALEVTRSNLSRLQRHHEAVLPVTVLESDWLAALPSNVRGMVQLVVANPPYVAEDEWVDLDEEVRREPRRALVAPAGRNGTPGLADVEAVLAQSLDWLARPGAVVVELAPHQADAAAMVARSMGYVDVRVEPDLAGLARVLVGRVR